jgi:hypothetical protein
MGLHVAGIALPYLTLPVVLSFLPLLYAKNLGKTRQKDARTGYFETSYLFYAARNHVNCVTYITLARDFHGNGVKTAQRQTDKKCSD